MPLPSYFARLALILGASKRQLPALGAVFVLSALLDLASVGIVPLAVSLALQRSTEDPANLSQLYSATAIGLALAVIAVFGAKNLTGYLVARYIARSGERLRTDATERLLRAYLFAPYEFHLATHSSELVNALTGNLNSVFASVTALLKLACDVVMFLVVLGFLLWMDPLPVVAFLCLMGLAGYVYQRSVRHQITRAGRKQQQSYVGLIQNVQQSIYAYKEIKILGVEHELLEATQRHSRELAAANAYAIAAQAVPRLIMETLLVTLTVVIVLLSYLKTGDIKASLVFLAAFAAAGLRLLPAITQGLNAINIARFSTEAVERLSEHIRRAALVPLVESARRNEAVAARPFAQVSVENITYTYPGGSRPAVDRVSFEFRRGETIGVIGRTGAGKSTLVDVLIGLLKPQEGRILVDGADMAADPGAWMQLIAYVPQQINILDDTLRRNVALGIADGRIDDARVLDALQRAQAGQLVAGERGLDVKLGERGIRLSGGERQRVALARALYHRRQIIVLDEATSALDTETERLIVESMRELHGQFTFITIAHRHTTLSACDRIYEIDAGAVRSVLSYKELEGRTADASARRRAAAGVAG